MTMDYESLLSLMRGRRSIRRFTRQPVSRDHLDSLLEAARWAPSNHNRQPWRLIILEDRAVIQQLAEQVRRGLLERLHGLPATARPFVAGLVEHGTLFREAPVLIAAFHRQPVSVAAAVLDGLPNAALVSGEPLSVAMAVQNLLLAAHALGLGACVLTAPLLASDHLRVRLPWPEGYDPTCLIAVGHPDESPPAPRRKSLELMAEFRDNPGSITTHEDDPGHL
jgi:nitroreductase